MSDTEEALDIFQEPEDYYPPEKPHTFETFQLQDGREVSLRLVGHNPLWGHLLWQAGRIISTFLQTHASELNIKHATVLELGAGAGLPSLVCAILGAKQVVVTDYPDADLIENLAHNINLNMGLLSTPLNIIAEGYLWGAAITSLTAHLSEPPTTRTTTTPSPRFTLLLLADLLFNHSEHKRLLRTVALSLARTREARALIFFTPYRPWLFTADLNFIELASGKKVVVNDARTSAELSTEDYDMNEGLDTEDKAKQDADGDSGIGKFAVGKILETKMEKVMFEEDRGDEGLRRTVFGFEMRWADLV